MCIYYHSIVSYALSLSCHIKYFTKMTVKRLAGASFKGLRKYTETGTRHGSRLLNKTVFACVRSYCVTSCQGTSSYIYLKLVWLITPKREVEVPKQLNERTRQSLRRPGHSSNCCR
jgi:hypothetical protein